MAISGKHFLSNPKPAVTVWRSSPTSLDMLNQGIEEITVLDFNPVLIGKLDSRVLRKFRWRFIPVTSSWRQADHFSPTFLGG